MGVDHSTRRGWSMALVVLAVQLRVIQSQGWGFSEAGMKQYCEGQDFEAKCEADEVVLMHAAVFGRMHRSDCLQIQSGDRNCKVDVINYFDSRCSGRHGCVVRVSSIIDEYPSQDCLLDYRGYLEADYSCVKVSTGSKLQCATSSTIQATVLPSGYFASVVSDETNCGSLDCPWVLTVPSGQTIRISLLDSAASARNPDGFIQDIPQVCHVYAVIRESSIGASETICGSNTRTNLVYTSMTNHVEVRMTSKQKNNDGGYFLLKYTAVGCPDLAPPVNGWLERLDDSVLFGCNGSDDTWRLVCENSQWTGLVGKNCSVGGGKVAAGHDRTIIGLLTGTEWASIVIILTIAVTLGLTIFLIGLVYLRRKRDRQERQLQATIRAERQSIPDYYATQNQDNITVDSGYGNGTTKSLPPTDAFPSHENDYFRTWQMQRHLPGGRGGSLPPQTSYDTMDPNKVRNVEHIYESPKFDRKDRSLGSEGEPGNVQYYELDPEAVDDDNNHYPG